MQDILLRTYQQRGIAYLRRHKGNCILAMDMGLGKTLTSLVYASQFDKILILCPSSVKYQWAEEIFKWYGKQRISILSGIKKREGTLNQKYTILNYKIAKAWSTELSKQSYDVVIMDECHYLKEAKSERTKATRAICKNIPMKIGLSGTPMMGKPIDLFSPCRIINTKIFPSYFKFGYRYCYMKDFWSPKGYSYNGAQNLEELSRILHREIMYRKRKEDVLGELPDNIKTVIPLKIVMTEYNKLKDDAKNWLIDKKIEKDSLLAINKIEYLKQVVAKHKLPEIFEWIDTFLMSGKKLCLFATHKEIIDAVVNRYKAKSLKIDGSIPVKKRRGIVKAFQTLPGKRIIIGNIQAMGTGTDGLQNICSDVGFIEFPWTYEEIKQAYSRLHRIGQKDTVSVYFFVAKHTIDMDILDIVTKKKELTDKTIDQTNSSTLKNLISKL